jgi:hypothetical protein
MSTDGIGLEGLGEDLYSEANQAVTLSSRGYQLAHPCNKAVLSHQLVTHFVDDEHQPRRSECCERLPGTGQGLGRHQEQGAGEEVRPHEDASPYPPIRPSR